MLATPVDKLPHTSGLTKKRMHAAGIDTYKDLLMYAPNRYEDYSRIIRIADTLRYLDQKVTIQGVVVGVMPVHTRSRISLQKVHIADQTGKLTLSFFNQPYILAQMKKGEKYAFAGTVKQFGSSVSLQPETFEHIPDVLVAGVQTGRILPVYSEAKGLSSRLLREKISGILPLADVLPETLPMRIIEHNHLLPLRTAFHILHRPNKMEELAQAKQRLAFEELFMLQLATSLVKKIWSSYTVPEPIKDSPAIRMKLNKAISSLPFTLTADQLVAFEAITRDMTQTKPMNRFLQGDVGSGKTIVAALAAYFAYLSGKKTLYMAPTELLALQHAETFKRFLEPFGVHVHIHTGSKKDLRSIHMADVIIGTHALLHLSESLSSVALIVIDEQHRFGVKQRALLKAKGQSPHLLTMTATPIPRTVALTAFGELAMSVLTTMPSGRKPIRTYVVTNAKRADAYRWMEHEMQEYNVQIFIICPLVAESTAETMQSVKAATGEFEVIRKQFGRHAVGLLHGKMKAKEKEEVLNKFRNHTLDILVSTSVVEVGIDIPNATIMVIEGAERFGLSQLHQLRGRVGRGGIQSHCLLFSSAVPTPERLRVFAATTDGMKLAEHDLAERGPGNMFGVEQHGFMEMRFASFTDLSLIERVQKAVDEFRKTEKVEDYPALAASLKTYNTKEITKD